SVARRGAEGPGGEAPREPHLLDARRGDPRDISRTPPAGGRRRAVREPDPARVRKLAPRRGGGALQRGADVPARLLPGPEDSARRAPDEALARRARRHRRRAPDRIDVARRGGRGPDPRGRPHVRDRDLRGPSLPPEPGAADELPDRLPRDREAKEGLSGEEGSVLLRARLPRPAAEVRADPAFAHPPRAPRSPGEPVPDGGEPAPSGDRHRAAPWHLMPLATATAA